MKVSKLLKSTFLGKLIQTEDLEERTYLALTLITGVCAGVIAVFINKCVHYLTHIMKTGEVFTKESLMLGGIAVFISGFITTRFLPSTSGSGIPGVRVALAVFHGKLTIRQTLGKMVTSILSLSSGMSLGREGPTVAISSGIGSIFGHFFSMSKKKVKSLTAIGAAGGIAAAFNTPMAAVVFTLEEVVGDLNAKVLGSIIIASVIAAVTASTLIGDRATFTTFQYHLNDHRELLIFLFLGIIAAILGPLWVKSVLTLRKLNLKIFRGHRLTIIMMSFLFMAAISLYNTDVLGGGHNAIEKILLGVLKDWKLLLTLLILKFIATTVCYASGVSGGLFMPTLLMGATLGGLVGAIAQILFPEIVSNPLGFALVGMGAFFVSVIRTPFTSIIIIFEMTRDYNIILPLMVSNIVAHFLATRIHKGSIYENISEQDGIHLPTREDHDVLEVLLVEDSMVTDVVSLNASMTVREAMKMCKGNEVSGYPVLKNGILVGMISTADIGSSYVKNLGDSTIEAISTKKLIKIHPDQSLLVAFHKLKKFQISRLPVVSRINDRRIVGIITAEDIVNRFGYHTVEQSKKDVIDKFEQEFDECHKSDPPFPTEAVERDAKNHPVKLKPSDRK